MPTDIDIHHLHEALTLAKIRRGFCAPNPSVGAVIVKDNKVLATGYHFAPGLPHAEIEALKHLQHSEAVGATIYVTLEPCCHFGRTPPCTDSLIKAGIQRVVYGYRDPNDIVAGKGETALLAAGMLCEWISTPEINAFYESYHYWHKTKKPFVTAKIALSLDGKIAGKAGQPVQITGEALRELTHYCRQSSDAILTTAKTIIHDDPSLNVRRQQETIAKPLYILDSQLNLPKTAKVFKTAKSLTVFHSHQAAKARRQALIAQGVRCLAVDHNAEGLLLEQVLTLMGQDGIQDLWIEAGGNCFAAWFNAHLLQQAFIYHSLKWLGEGIMAFPPHFSFDVSACQIRWQQIGNDVLCEIRW